MSELKTCKCGATPGVRPRDCGECLDYVIEEGIALRTLMRMELKKRFAHDIDARDHAYGLAMENNGRLRAEVERLKRENADVTIGCPFFGSGAGAFGGAEPISWEGVFLALRAELAQERAAREKAEARVKEYEDAIVSYQDALIGDAILAARREEGER